jgi:hypothetical protein
MNINLIQKSIIPLTLSTLLIGSFYGQFTYNYSYIIENFKAEKLSSIYSYLFIYSFFILTLFISIANTINYFFLKSKLFISIVVIALLSFYALLFEPLGNIIHYFLRLSFDESMVMGMVMFVVSTFGYALYSLILVPFNRFIPLLHVALFTLFSLLFSLFFIDSFCMPIGEFLTKL